AAADPVAAVENGSATRHEHEQREQQRHRKRAEEKERREEDVEQSQDGIAPSRRRLERQLPVAADERVLDEVMLDLAALILVARKAVPGTRSAGAGHRMRHRLHNDCLWTRGSWRRSAP